MLGLVRKMINFDLFGKAAFGEVENLRIPYMGSKNRIAKQLFEKMLEIKPNAKYFFDLFGGGGAMSFYALQLGLKVHYNEKQKGMVDLLSYILTAKKGKFGIFPDDFYEFITREQFQILKDEDSLKGQFARICYSFGNNQTAYSFYKNGEKIKKLGQDFVFKKQKIDGIPDIDSEDFNKRRSFLSQFSKKTFLEIIEKEPELKKGYETYLKIVKSEFFLEEKYLFTRWLKSTGITCKEVDILTGSQMGSHFLSQKSQPAIPTKEMMELLKKSPKLKKVPEFIESLFDEKKIRDFRKLQQLEQLERLERLQQLPTFTITNLDFQDVRIETPIQETIIYLDPPYRGTAEYKESALFGDVDNYFKNSPYTCFMSEYNAPFDSVLEIKKASLLNNSDLSERKYAIEKLFWNKK